MALFVGRLPTYDFDDRDLEDIFYKYGRILNCQLKRGTRFAFGFVEFEDPEDAYDAIRDVDGIDIDGVRIVVERAKGSPREREDNSTCYNCGGRGHWARHCSRSRRYSRSYSRSRSPYERRRRSYSRSRSSSYSRSRSPRRRSRSRTPTRGYYSRSRSPSRD